MPFINERPEVPSADNKCRTIDHERNVFFFLVRGVRPEDERKKFILNVAGDEVKIITSCRQSLDKNELDKRLYIMDWLVEEIHPRDNQINKAFLNSLITEALEAYGWNYDTSKASSVTVEFSNELH